MPRYAKPYHNKGAFNVFVEWILLRASLLHVLQIAVIPKRNVEIVMVFNEKQESIKSFMFLYKIKAISLNHVTRYLLFNMKGT